MIETGGQKLVFCCAKGEFRGPAASEMVMGSEFVEGGYTGLFKWLNPEPEEEQICDIRLFYGGTVMILIADKPDLAQEEFAKSLVFVSDLLTKADIDFAQLEYQDLICKIASHDNIRVIHK